MEDNSNDEEIKVNVDNDYNYDHLSQLRVNKNVHEARSKWKLQVVTLECREDISKVTMILGTSSSHVQKATMVEGRKHGVLQCLQIKNFHGVFQTICHHLVLVLER